jgi:ParB/RepB/Spo0J family partition protein
MSVGEKVENRSKLKHIPVNLIREVEGSLRGVKRGTPDYERFVASVRKDGIQNPVLLREMKDPNTGDVIYSVIEGRHRYCAAKDIGLETIPAQIKTMQDADILMTQVIGNLQRIETKPAEYSKALVRLLDQKPTMTHQELATMLSASPQWLKQRLRLADLPQHIAELVDDGKIPLSNAYELAALIKEAPEETEAWLTRAQTEPAGDFTVAAQQRVKDLKEEKRKGRDPNRNKVFTPVPSIRNMGPVKDLYNDGNYGPDVAKILETAGATTTEEGFRAAIEWVLQLDKPSVEAGQKKFEEARAKAEAERAARLAEKQRQRDEAANAATQQAMANAG